MAREMDLSQADTAAPARRAAVDREIRRRDRATRMGTGGGGNDIGESVHVPASLATTRPTAMDITWTFRYVDRTARNTDDRVELLHMILGE